MSAAAELLARRSLVALAPYAAGGDLATAPTGVAIASLDGEAMLPLDDDGRALLASWTAKKDRVFLFDEARPALRRLLRAGVDVARPICRLTLERLASAAGDASDTGQVMRDPHAALSRAKQLLGQLPEQLERVERAGHKRVARLECLVLRAFAALEDRGLPVDAKGWRLLVDEEKLRAQVAREEIVALGGNYIARDLFGTPEVNLDAEQEVKQLVERVTARKLESVDRHALAALDHPIAKALLLYRESMKIVSTYGDTFLARVQDGRVHATFVPLGASTGRVASRDPNLQNLPSDARFHRCLKAPAGRVLVTADYATCELRIVAELSGDPVFRRAFEANEDLHATVASTMFNKKVSKTENAELRQRAKGINFGLVYGMGPAALATSIGVPLDEGERLLQQYFRTFPKIKDYLEGSVETGLKRGYAETMLGRRLVFAEDTLKSSNARGELSRIAKNMPIQGTSADMTKLAMVRVHERLTDEFPKGPPGRHGLVDAGLVNTIHDELVVECRDEDGDKVAAAVSHEMSEAHRTLLKTVPPLVEVHVGPHWHH